MKTIAQVQDNSRTILNGIIGVVVLGALLLIGWLIYSRRANSAGESLAEAFRVDSAIVANPLPSTLQPGQYAYTTQDEKHRKAFEAFNKAANDYPSYNGEVAGYYAATHQLAFEPEKAEQALKQLAQKSSPLGRQAQMTLAGRYEVSGRFDEAIAEYKKLQASPGDQSTNLIKLKIARCLEGAGKKNEAADIYFEIASDKDVRALPLGTEAVTRLTLLDPNRVEKLPAPETAPGVGGASLGGAPISVR